MAWDDATLFDGNLLFIAATPALGAGSYPQIGLRGEVPKVRLPRHVVIPVKAGVVSNIAQLPRTDHLQPPTCRYCWWVYDANDVQIAQGGSLITAAAATLELTPPTLEAPTVAASCPVPGTGVSGEVQNVISTAAPTLEDIAGTKDGANTAFTISTDGTLVQVYWNGDLQDEGVDYSRSGTAITMISPAIPEASDSLQAVIFA